MKRFAFAALLVVIVIVGGAARGEAAGSLTWTLQKTPTPNVTAGGGELTGVSCPSLTDCVAVGSDVEEPPLRDVERREMDRSSYELARRRAQRWDAGRFLPVHIDVRVHRGGR